MSISRPSFPNREALTDLQVDLDTLVTDAVNDRIGLGTASPGTQLQITSAAPYVTLQNSTAENSDGGCESKIIFEDHADVALAQVEGSHSGSSDDTKGKLILSTHTGSALTAALTINESQQATFGGDVVVGGATPTLTIGDAGAEDTMLVFDGNAADYRIGLDDGTDNLEIGVGAAHGTTTAIGINASAQTQVLAAFAANVAGTFGTFSDGDATPSVATGNLWKHHASGQTITMFDDGIAGQTIHVISTAAIVYDVTGTNLKGGSADITTASGDITSWFFDGTNWYLIQFMDVSADMSSVGGGGGSTDLNGLSAAAVDVAADSIGIIDANDSNASKKESIADFISAVAGTGLAASSGQLTVSAANTATALVSGGVRGTADQLGEVLFNQVFS